MTGPGGPPKLPTAIRNAALACMILSAIVGYFSVSEAFALIQLSALKAPSVQFPGALGSEALEKGFEAQLAALASMRVPRVLTLSSLALACALNFVAAGRLIRPRGLHRQNMRKVLVSSSIAISLLRTVDGAQLAVVARKVGTAVGRATDSIPGLADSPIEVQKLLRSLATGIAIFQTVAVVGAFAILSQYFRTQKVKQLLGGLEREH